MDNKTYVIYMYYYYYYYYINVTISNVVFVCV